MSEWARPDMPGFFLRELLLGGDSAISEGINRFDHWAVRLECDPRSPRARMATLHEMYHGFLNDSTAYGTLLHTAALWTRELPGDDACTSWLIELIGQAIEVHETYATYASAFIIGRGDIDRALLDAYPGYERYLDYALAFAATMPNPIVGFQAVGAATRAAMQIGCIERFATVPAASWSIALLPPSCRPDVRFEWLRRREAIDGLRSALAGWNPTDPLVRDVLTARVDHDWSYDGFVTERFDPAIDAIGGFLYDHCRQALESLGAPCLAFNGHQTYTAVMLERAAVRLGAERVDHLLPAPVDSRLDDLVGGFAQERLVLSTRPMSARWWRLRDIPRDARRLLSSGPPPHALIIARSARRLAAQYEPAPPCPPNSVVTAIRRRAPDVSGRPTVEWFIIESADDLVSWSAEVANETAVVSCVSMAALADDDWREQWLDVLQARGTLDVLIDLDPFVHFRRWHAQAAFTTHYARIDLTDGERTHIVFALQPGDADSTVWLAPCSAPLAAAMVAELQRLESEGGRFVQDDSFVHARMESLRLVLSHLLREESWFDFRGGRA